MKGLQQIFIAGIIVACFTTLSPAQDRRPPEPPPPAPGPAPQRVEQFKKMRLIEDLQLDEETSIRFFARYNKQTEALRDIDKQQAAIIRQLKELIRTNAPAAEMDAAIKNYCKLESQSADIRAKFVEGLKEIFTPKQIAEYLIFEQNFNQNLRDVLRDMTRERMGHMD